jgi:hypothetical protein
MLTSRDAIQCYISLLWTHRPPGHVIPVPCIPVGLMSLYCRGLLIDYCPCLIQCYGLYHQVFSGTPND